MNEPKVAFRQFLAALLLAIFLLVYLHPYYGIRHDAILYLGQALLRLDPVNFKRDLFFAYGSQADFTIFPQLLALLLPHIDAAHTFIALTLFGLFFFVLASATLLRTIFPSPTWYWSLLALLIFPGTYGGHEIFGYLETFFTGRSMAEPLVLLAVFAYVTGRRAIAAMLLLASFALHPLQAIPAVVLWWCDRVFNDRRWLHLLWLPLVVVVAGLIGLPPADKLVARFDPQWFDWIVGPSRHVFIHLWTPHNFLSFATDVFLVALTFTHGTGIAKTLARNLLVATALCFLASLLLADLLQLVLPTALQLWRVQWLLHWLAVASIPFLLHHFWREGKLSSIRFWLLIAVIFFGVTTPDHRYFIAVGGVAIFLFCVWPLIENKVSQPYKTALLASIPLSLAIATVKYSFTVISKFKAYGYSREALRPEFVIVHQPLIIGILVASGIFLYLHKKHTRSIFVTLLLALLIYSGAEWDRRSTWTKYIESAKFNPSLFGQMIEEGSQVFWAEELTAPWLILRRPSYFSGQQMAGILFNRETAREAFERIKVMEVINAQNSTCRLVNELNKSNDFCTVDLSAAADACIRSKGQLAYIIIDTKMPVKPFGAWEITGGPKGDTPITYYAYRCKDLSVS